MNRLVNRPTDSELEILKVLWNKGPSTVRSVNEELNKVKKTGYTTTLKIMQIMLKKGMVKRDDKSRTHIYRPVSTREDVQGDLLEKFLQNTFSGSAYKMVLKALGTHKPSKDELDQIKELIEKIEKGNDRSDK